MSNKLKLAAAVAAMSLFSGNALAVKPLGTCSAGSLGAQIDLLDVVVTGFVKYCNKGPDAALAAKSSEKLAKKANKIAEKYNDKLIKLDCATEFDPDLGAPMPLPTPVVTAAALETQLLGLEGACDGIVTPP